MRERLGVLLAGALCAVASSGCFKATFGDPTQVPGIEHNRWTDFYLYGLVGDEVVDVNEFCSDGRAYQVRTGGNFGSVLVTVVTLGIYAPRVVWVTCSAGTQTAALREEELR
jgi:hypothetical protein